MASRLKRFIMWCTGFMVTKSIQGAMINHVRSYNGTNTGLVAHYFGKAPFKRTSFSVEWLGNGRMVPFESARLPVPEEVERYLEFRYGNYLDMPDAETIAQYPPHAEFVSVDKDYTNSK